MTFRLHGARRDILKKKRDEDMSLEKLSFTKISAPPDLLDDVLGVCLDSGCFHPENTLSLLGGSRGTFADASPDTSGGARGDNDSGTAGSAVPKLKYIKVSVGKIPDENSEERRLYDDDPYLVFASDPENKDPSSGYYFAPADSSESQSGNGYAPVDTFNPWSERLTAAIAMCGSCGVKPEYSDPSDLMLNDDALAERMDRLSSESTRLSESIKALSEEYELLGRGIEQLSHMKDINYDLDKLFGLKHVKLRFGRMPRESYEKLRLYVDNPHIVFIAGSSDKKFVWGCYFAPASSCAEADEVFSSLYFERLRISSEAHGTPSQALERFSYRRTQVAKQLEEAKKQLKGFSADHAAECRKLFSRFKYLYESRELRRYAAVHAGQAVVCGWIPKNQAVAFDRALSAVPGAKFECGDSPFSSEKLTPPTKLKNPRIFRPFEMFVKMYGIPSANEIDPTPLVAIVYSLLFGAMFGDVGHGLVLIVAGILADRVLGLKLGKILPFIGGSSMLFGFIYGSVFGFEHLLDPMYKALGFEEKPIDVMDGGTVNTILFAAIGVGAVLTVISMIINIVNGIKQRDATKALFSQSGTAGIIFFVSVLVAVGLIMLLGVNLLSPWFIGIFVVIPLVLIFLREPLGRMVSGRRQPDEEELTVGSFILQNFFEMIEVLLSYVSNTISFIRVGAFVMSHAIMMSVVFMLAQTASASANAVILVIGNAFVIALEGLIVGIQVLRLHFYEIFSRFYSGGGREFVPISIDYNV